MAGKGIAGGGGDVLQGVGGSPTQIAEVTKVSFNPKATNAAYRSNRTAGYTQRQPGYKDASGSFDFAWDPTNPLTSQLDITDLIVIQIQTMVGQRIIVPAIIDDIKLDIDIAGATIIGGSCSYSANGPWTNPSATSSLMGPIKGAKGKIFLPADAEQPQAVPAAPAVPIARPVMPMRPAAAARSQVDPELVAAVAQAVLQVLRAEGFGLPSNGGRAMPRAA